MTITNKNTNGVRTIPLGEREVMQELTSADPNYGKIRVGTNGTYVGEVLIAKDSDVVTNANAIVVLDNRLDTAESTLGSTVTAVSGLTTRVTTVENTLVSSNIARADKYLASQNIASMTYVSGDLVKIQYNTATNNDYEVLGYTGGNLTTIQHYVSTVLKGTTTLSHTDGSLTSAVFVGV